jgi:hypothetical protein
MAELGIKENEEYKYLYGDGPIKVGLILRDTRVGVGNEGDKGDSGNLQLEGILTGETIATLQFKEIKSSNAPEISKYFHPHIFKFFGGKGQIRKDQISIIYEILEGKKD